jgi:phosphoglycolate phosphatase
LTSPEAGGQRLVIFDLDGTLIDSRRDLADSANEMLMEYGAAPLTEDAIGHMVGGGAAQLVARALEAAHVAVPLENALARFLMSYDRRLTNHTRPYQGIPEMLSELASQQVRMALLTNKPLEASERILDTFGLSRFFRLRVGGDGPWPRKPAPEGLQFLMKEESVQPSHTVLVGDSAVDLATARNAGVRICLARYGFGFADLAPETLRGDEMIVGEPREIVDAVR